jgi:S1-C subfamily serine protease
LQLCREDIREARGCERVDFLIDSPKLGTSSRPMNAAVRLLERSLPSTVHVRTRVPEPHPSAAILGTERAGSGTVVSTDGLILTVQYIVLGADHIEVSLIDGTTAEAEVLAQDFTTGIALLRIESRTLPAARLHSSTGIAAGEEVFLLASAAENTRRASNGAVMSIEAFDAYWEYSLDRAITTTAVNPGLSGGGMYDANGQMVGIVSLDLNEIGRMTLAIPVENFLDHRDELLRHGRRVSHSPRAWLGLYCYTLRDRLVVAAVLPGTPAEEAGLKPGDLLLTLNGRAVRARRDLYHQLWEHRPGESFHCTIFRESEVKQLTIQAGNVEEFFA